MQLPLGFDFPDAPSGPPPTTKARAARKPKAASSAANPADIASMATAVAAHPDYRVLTRLQPCLNFERATSGPTRQVLVLDTETTGLNSAQDKIIELALLRVAVDVASGLPVGLVQVYDGLEDPGRPLSKEVRDITGITDALLQGQALDEVRIAQMLEGVDLVIAHNAGFDRPFCESRLSAFAKLPWACSFADLDWKAQGHGSSKLEYLALEKGWFYDAHRAQTDCHALLAILAAPLATSDGTGLARMLAASAQTSYRLQATQAPFDAKDLLKARSYRWCAEQKVWQTKLADDASLEAELTWLKKAVYGGRAVRVQVEKVSSLVKYASRVGEISHPQL